MSHVPAIAIRPRRPATRAATIPSICRPCRPIRRKPPKRPPARGPKDDPEKKTRDHKDKAVPDLNVDATPTKTGGDDTNTPPVKDVPKKGDPDSLPIEPPPAKT